MERPTPPYSAKPCAATATISLVEVPGDWFKISEGNITAAQVYTACVALNVATMNKATSPVFQIGPQLGARQLRHVALQSHHAAQRAKLLAHDGGGNLGTSVNDNGGATTASSRHPGGVNLTCVDGSGRFVSETIDLMVWQAGVPATAAKWSARDSDAVHNLSCPTDLLSPCS